MKRPGSYRLWSQQELFGWALEPRCCSMISNSIRMQAIPLLLSPPATQWLMPLPAAVAAVNCSYRCGHTSHCYLHRTQTGLFQLVRDYDVYTFKNNVLALAATAKLYGVPTILTSSLEKGPNGPLLPELRAMLPNTTFIPRPGEINAWDNTDFVNAVKVRQSGGLPVSCDSHTAG
eukprot:GHRQ01005410.1.p1 GENE.GHRQ01005410.1~~GHRQ01005410.1.p1  ORF type:complete len:175 (-),score=54.92 GHRQ01005410.1:2121-2645(-)